MTRTVSRFFPAVSGLLVAGLFVGFARTFFLRSLFNVRPIPPYLYLHGALLTTWFVLVLAQTCLVASDRTAVHRRLGNLAVVVGALIIPISAFVVVRAAQRTSGEITPLLRLEVVGDLLSLVWFAGFVAAGYYFRRRPDFHKRFMIAACFLIYGPVLVRINLVYGLSIPPPIVAPLGLVTIGAYDLIAARRVHRATIWIAGLLAGVIAVLGLLIATGASDALIEALR